MAVLQPFSLLVKPVGSACNLRCHYCFYSDHAAGTMEPALFRRLLDSYLALPFAAKSIALQGGEPLLAPPAILAALGAAPLEKSIQTNGTLLTPALARRFADERWLVGVSLDGPRELNRLRGDSFEAAVRGIRALEAAGVDYNLLTVVSQANVRHAVHVYRYLRDTFATRYHQYIECTGPCDAIDGDAWGAFLVELFDAWIEADAHTVSIRLFDSLVSQMVRGVPTQCSAASSCRQYLVVEHDGSVYPCDFHVRADLKLGNIQTHTWEEMLDAKIYRDFAAAKTIALPPACRTCEFFRFCHGDCPRNRRAGQSILCTGWKRFFAHALDRLAALI